MAGVNDVFRQGGMALGVAAYGALVPAAAALGQGDAGSYVTGLHHALLVGVGVALAGAAVTAVLVGRPVRKPSSASFPVAEPAAETA